MSRLPAPVRLGVRRNATTGLFILCLATAGVLTGLAAAELAPKAGDRKVIKSVTSLLQKRHLSKAELDDEISRRAFKTYLKSLDPMKLYFTQADIDAFNANETKLDDMARNGDVQFGYDVFKVFLKRVDERVTLVNYLLDRGFDFTVDEELIADPDLLEYAKSDAEIEDKWRKRLKYDLLVLKSDKIEGKEANDKLRRRYGSFAKRMHQTHNSELLEMYLTALTTSYDPHTTYMSQDSLNNFEIQMRLQLDGIGASLQFEDGYTVVKSLIPNGAADKDGRLKPEDRVIGVGQGTDGEIVDVVDMNLTDVVKLIRGKKGTIVRLKVIPSGQAEPKTYDITRASIELTDSEARGEIIQEGKKADGTPYRVGVIDLPSFYMDMDGARKGLGDFKSTTRDVERILNDFKSKGVDAVVVDLRHNGGGSLTESISTTGLFIDQGPIVQVKDSEGNVQHYDDVDRGVVWDGPLVVLVNKFSASASEIFAGAIQDYRRGIVIGDRTTHGKGTVQSLLDLGRELIAFNAPELGALKITMQQFYRPNGDSTQNRGVISDIELPSLTTHYDVGESDLDYAVEFDRVQAAQFAKSNRVDQSTIDELRTRSEDRRSNNEEFQKMLRKITRYKQQKERKRVSLNEEKFMADRAELNAEKEEEKEFESLQKQNRPVVERDYYFNEALAITLDYLRLTKLAALN